MAKKSFFIPIVLLACLWVSRVHAQESDSLFLRFEARFALLDSIIRHPGNHVAYISRNTSSAGDSEHAEIEALRSAADSAIDRRVEEEIRVMKSVTGLTINGQAYTRLDDEFGWDDEDAVSRYKAKVQAELRWNFLSSSLIKRRGKANEIRIRGDIDRLDYRREELGRLVASQQEQFRIRYDSLLSGVLGHRIVNLALLADAQTYLLAKGGISSDELLEIIEEKAEAERMMAAIDRPSPPPFAGDLSNPSGVIVRVDSVRLLDFIQTYDTNTNSIELRRSLLDQQIANTSGWTALNLSPFVRFSYYMRPVVSNSSNIDVGLSFIVPIACTSAKKRRALRAERSVLDVEQERMSALVTERVRLVLLDIERMNRSIEGEVRRLAGLKGYLDLRRKAYENRIGEYDYLARMKEYNTYLLCCERLLSFSYRRDCLLASLQNYLPDTSILDFCVETELQAGSIDLHQ